MPRRLAPHGCGRSPTASTKTAHQRSATSRRARPRGRRSPRVGGGFFEHRRGAHGDYLMRNIEFHLNVLLAEAERLYGPRDATYRFAGVRFDPKGPHLRFSPTWDEIWIELSPSTMTYPDQALHQLAHEVIHLLAPDRSPPAVMLEEGLAVHFSVYAPTFISPTYRHDALKHLITRSSPRVAGYFWLGAIL